MTYYRMNWYYVGGVLFVALAFVMGFWGDHADRLRTIMVYSFMALLAHQVEEYAWPGGFPPIFNVAVFGEKAHPERYPLNTNQVLVTNVVLAYPIYLAGILWPHTIWLGIGVSLFGMLQLLVHGIVINIRFRSLYNPSLATTIALFIPVGVYYLWYVAHHDLASTADVIIGIVFALIGGVVTVALPIRFMRDRNSPYAFNEQQMGGYATGRWRPCGAPRRRWVSSDLRERGRPLGREGVDGRSLYSGAASLGGAAQGIG